MARWSAAVAFQYISKYVADIYIYIYVMFNRKVNNTNAIGVLFE